MKRFFCIMTSIFVTSTMLLCSSFNCSANGSSSDEPAEEFVYSVDFTSNEWYDMPLEDKLSRCDFPSNKLSTLTTAQLLELAVDYPLGIDLFFGDTFEEGFELMVSHSNVFKVLLTRTDLNDLILPYYSNLVDTFDKNEDCVRKLMIDSLIRHQWETMSASEKNAVVNIHSLISEDIWSCILGHIVNDYSARFVQNNTYISSEKLPDTRGFIANGPCQIIDFTTYQPGTYLKYGKACSCLRFESGDFSNDEKDAIKNEISDAFPNWIFSTNPTKRFNCHSYIWISYDTYSNIYTLDDPTPFTTATSYFYEENINTALLCGQYVLIYEIYSGNHILKHSVKVNTSSTGSNMNSYMSSSYVQSKVGVAGVYVTTLADMFSFYSGSYYVPFTVL
ncbi:MAG: hypothetical protein IKN24_06630 [Lachnospiraceae bacterium]|nr:hypothetical protein [Lachnospiraceae bacterium]